MKAWPRRLVLLLALLAASGAALMFLLARGLTDDAVPEPGLVVVPPANLAVAAPVAPQPSPPVTNAAEEREEIIPEALYDPEGKPIERCTTPEC